MTKVGRTPADHVGLVTPLLQVFDMPRSLAFYRDALGFRVVNTSHPGDCCDWAMLYGGGVVHGTGVRLMLNTAYEENERPAARDPARVAAHGDAALYFLCEDADVVYGLLCDAGLEPAAPRTAPYGMRQVYLKDPDGYDLCFQHPVGQEP